MRTLSRMLVKSIVPVFFAALVLAVTMLQLVDLFTNLWKYLNYSVPVSSILRVMMLYTPKCISYALSVALLFSVSYVLGTMYTNNELIAVFGSGIPLYRLAVPFIVFGLLLSVGDFYFENNVVITTLREKNALNRELLHQQVSLSNANITIISNTNTVIYRVDYYNDATRTLSGIEIVERDAQGDFLSRMDASQAQWQNGRWEFTDCQRYYWLPDRSSLTSSYSSLYSQANFNEPPDTFRRSNARVSEMRLSDARNHIRNLQRTGLPYAVELSEYYERFAYALTPLIIVFISIAFAGLFRKNILLMSLLSSLVTAVIYYVAQMVTMLMAKLGLITPFAGSCLPTLLFAAAAAFSFRFART